MIFKNIQEACQAACLEIGVKYKPVPSDGRFYVADLLNDPRGQNDGRIRLFSDQNGGQVWNHKSGENKTFFLNHALSGQRITPEERQRIEAEQRKGEVHRLRTQNKKADEAREEFIRAKKWPFPPTGYMIRKELPHSDWARLGQFNRKVKCNDEIRRIVIDDVLLIPIVNKKGVIRNLQYIFPESHPMLGRDKTFIFGAELSGCFSCVGFPYNKLSPARNDLLPVGNPLFITEGFANAISLYHDTGCRVFIAFSASNLMNTGKIIRSLHPDREIIFCADNDDKTAGNPGVTKANEAAALIDAKVFVPPISGDYNDWYIEKRKRSQDVELMTECDHE